MFLLLRLRPPGSTLFPYTTLFRSGRGGRRAEGFGDNLNRPFTGLEIVEPDLAELHELLHEIVRSSDENRVRRSEEHTSELQSHHDLVCRLLLEKKNRSERQDGNRY